MELKINRLRIKNFRNINELEINFKDKVTKILGENGKGKTNTLSAIMWCLFGKNIYDDKKFVISPIIDNEEKNDITTNVTLILNDNYVISRTWYQRKASVQTGYIIDGKEELTTITQSQFTDELKDKFGIDEETFKSLSNINYLPNLNWKDLKEFIFKLIGEVKDEEVLLRGDFGLVEEQIKLMGINSTKDSLTASDKDISEEIKRLETEYQTLVNTKEKYVADEEQNIELKNRKKEIEEEIAKYQEKQKEEEKIKDDYNNKQKEISNIEDQIQHKNNQLEFNNNAIEDYKKSYELNSVSVDVIREKEKSYVQNKINSVNERLNALDKQSQSYDKEITEINRKGKELQEKEIKVENDTCNTCGQKLPEEKIKSILDKLKEQQLEELNRLQEQAKSLKTIIGANANEFEQKINELEELEKQLVEVDTKVYEEQEETEKQKEIRVAKENKELENKQLIQDIETLKAKLENLTNELNSMTKPSIELNINQDLFKELDEINSKLATSITLSKISEDVEKANVNLANAKDKKVVIKNKLEQVAKFNNLKADLVRQKVKSHFKIVDFKTKEFTQDGIEQETFKICIDGIDYKELNTGMKMLVAIDLLVGIQKLKDIHTPIIIDNAENITSDISVEDTQLIIAVATRGITELEVK